MHADRRTPLEDYVLTTRDHIDQREVMRTELQARRFADEMVERESADDELRARHEALIQQVWQELLARPTPAHQLMRWRVRLYCGHITEKVCHTDHSAPNLHTGRAVPCRWCELPRSLIVAWEPVGLLAPPPEGT